MLSIRVELEEPQEPIYLEGALRGKADAMITLRTDPQGNPVHFGFITNMNPSPENKRSGVPLDGEIPTGLLYSCYLNDVDGQTASMHGWSAGLPADLDQSVSILSSSWMSSADIGELDAAFKKIQMSLDE